MTLFHIRAFVFGISTIITICSQGNAKISCRDAKGKAVDWFVVYKIPKTKFNPNSFMQPKGGEMAYYDQKTRTVKWTLLSSDINNKTGNPIANTLAPIYDEKSKVAYLAYNDQLPHTFSGTRGGHTKGVLMAGNGVDFGTVWLQHSVPRFVDDVKYGYKYPENGRENGQLFFCITFPLGTVEKISYHLQLQAANVYQSRYFEWTNTYKEFAALLQKHYIRKPSGIKVDILLTRKTRPVLAIAKSHTWTRDIYSEELIRQMNDSMAVQTWKNGIGGAQTTQCNTKHSITDVEEVGLRTQKGPLTFSSKEDHSKWSVARKKAVFCFSSLNRMFSQWKRGGEITCIIDVPLAKLFRDSIFKQNECRGSRQE